MLIKSTLPTRFSPSQIITNNVQRKQGFSKIWPSDLVFDPHMTQFQTRPRSTQIF